MNKYTGRPMLYLIHWIQFFSSYFLFLFLFSFFLLHYLICKLYLYMPLSNLIFKFGNSAIFFILTYIFSYPFYLSNFLSSLCWRASRIKFRLIEHLGTILLCVLKYVVFISFFQYLSCLSFLFSNVLHFFFIFIHSFLCSTCSSSSSFFPRLIFPISFCFYPL